MIASLTVFVSLHVRTVRLLPGRMPGMPQAACQALAVSTAAALCVLQPIPPWKNPAELEPSTHYMTVEDPNRPADVRFLHVLQVVDATSPDPTPATLLTGSVNGGALGSAHGERFLRDGVRGDR